MLQGFFTEEIIEPPVDHFAGLNEIEREKKSRMMFRNYLVMMTPGGALAVPEESEFSVKDEELEA